MARELDEQPPCKECGCHLAYGHKGSHAAIGSFLGFTRWKVWRNDAPDAYSPRPWDIDAANIDDLERGLR